MRISELAQRSGVPIPTVKFYIREGMLPRGASTGSTSAVYGEEHLARLRLIAALASSAQLPLARVREVLQLVDEPLNDPIETMGHAVAALPPYVDEEPDYPRARAALAQLGMTYEPAFPATAQLERAIRSVEDAALPWNDETISRYGAPMRGIAAAEIAPIPDMAAEDRVPYAVLGTALYEPVILALRRLAHHDALVRGTPPLGD